MDHHQRVLEEESGIPSGLFGPVSPPGGSATLVMDPNSLFDLDDSNDSPIGKISCSNHIPDNHGPASVADACQNMNKRTGHIQYEDPIISSSSASTASYNDQRLGKPLKDFVCSSRGSTSNSFQQQPSAAGSRTLSQESPLSVLLGHQSLKSSPAVIDLPERSASLIPQSLVGTHSSDARASNSVLNPLKRRHSLTDATPGTAVHFGNPPRSKLQVQGYSGTSIVLHDREGNSTDTGYSSNESPGPRCHSPPSPGSVTPWTDKLLSEGRLPSAFPPPPTSAHAGPPTPTHTGPPSPYTGRPSRSPPQGPRNTSASHHSSTTSAPVGNQSNSSLSGPSLPTKGVRFQRTADALHKSGLWSVAMKTGDLMKRNRQLQRDLESFKTEALNLLKSILKEPGNLSLMQAAVGQGLKNYPPISRAAAKLMSSEAESSLSQALCVSSSTSTPTSQTATLSQTTAKDNTGKGFDSCIIVTSTSGIILPGPPPSVTVTTSPPSPLTRQASPASPPLHAQLEAV